MTEPLSFTIYATQGPEIAMLAWPEMAQEPGLTATQGEP